MLLWLKSMPYLCWNLKEKDPLNHLYKLQVYNSRYISYMAKEDCVTILDSNFSVTITRVCHFLLICCVWFNDSFIDLYFYLLFKQLRTCVIFICCKFVITPSLVLLVQWSVNSPSHLIRSRSWTSFRWLCCSWFIEWLMSQLL